MNGLFGSNLGTGTSAFDYVMRNPFLAQQQTNTGSYANRDLQGRTPGMDGWQQPPSILDALMPAMNAIPDGKGGYKAVFGQSPTIAAIQAMADQGLLGDMVSPSNAAPAAAAEKAPKKRKAKAFDWENLWEANVQGLGRDEDFGDFEVAGPNDWRKQFNLVGVTRR